MPKSANTLTNNNNSNNNNARQDSFLAIRQTTSTTTTYLTNPNLLHQIAKDVAVKHATASMDVGELTRIAEEAILKHLQRGVKRNSLLNPT